MNKNYQAPQVDIVALCQEETISDSFPYNDSELGWS